MSEAQKKTNRAPLTWYQKQVIKAHSELIEAGRYLTASDWRKMRQGPYFEELDRLTFELDKLKYKLNKIKNR
jgi:hypothetical protein